MSLLRPTRYTISRHLDKDWVRIDRKLLPHLHPNTALYLTTLMHLDECARATANSAEQGSYTGWFLVDRDTLIQLASISPRRQLAAQQQLKDLRVLRTKRKGMPAKSYFYLNVDQMWNLFGVEHGDLRPQSTSK